MSQSPDDGDLPKLVFQHFVKTVYEKIKNLNKNITKLGEENKEWKEKFLNLERHVETQQKSYITQTESAQQELDTMRKEKSEIEDVNKRLQDKNIKLRKNLDESEKEKQTIQSELAQCQVEVEKLQRRVMLELGQKQRYVEDEPDISHEKLKYVVEYLLAYYNMTNDVTG